MTKSYVLKVLFIAILIVFCNSCCKLFSDCPPKPTYEEAVATIKKFQNDMLESSNSVLLGSLQSATPGEVWIFNECENSIELYSVSPIDDFNQEDYGLMTENLNSKTYEFYWESSWINKPGFGIDISNDLIKSAFKAAAEYSDIHSIDFKISLKNPQYIRVKNIASLVNEYENSLDLNNDKTLGNIMISSIIKGKLNIEYKAKNEDEVEVEFDLSLDMNEILEREITLKPNVEYFIDGGVKDNFSIIEESGDFLTAFAIEYFPISSTVQDVDFINNFISEYCDGDETLVISKKVAGKCSNTGENIIDLTIEPGATEKEMYTHWTNKGDVPLTYIKGVLTIRNSFGQILDQRNLFETSQIDPGVTLSSGSFSTFVPGGYYYDLSDVEFAFIITEARNGYDVICN